MSCHDPLMLPQYLRFNGAIEQLTADWVAHDSGVFRKGRADIRHVVERQLYFALVADRKLFEYFVACETQLTLPDENDLSTLARQIAPYFRNARPSFGGAPTWKYRILRYLYRRHGSAAVRSENCGARQPRVLFLVIHSKFVRYLKPFAEGLSVPYAFLIVANPELFASLSEQKLPCVHIELSVESQAMMKPDVKILRFDFKPGLFDSLIIWFNAARSALEALDLDCVVVPEGNADIYELVNQSAKAIRLPTLCIQQGWSPVVHPGFRNMSYNRMCVWGQEFAELLTPYNPKQRFVVTGSHVIACGPQGEIKKQKAIAFFLQNGAHWMTERTWNSMLDLVAWAAQAFPDYEIRVREHPGEPLRQVDEARLGSAVNMKRMPANEFTLIDALSGCRVAIAMTSTTILEAAASGSIPLILDVNGFGPYHPDIVSGGAAIEVTSFCAARHELERLVNDEQYCASFAGPLEEAQRSLFARSGEQALNAIVAEINEMVAMQTREWDCCRRWLFAGA